MHISISSATIAIIWFNTFSIAAKFTYWVDRECDAISDFDDSLIEAIDLAKNTANRLQEGEDKQSDMHAIFERLFKTPTTDQEAFNIVHGEDFELHDSVPLADSPRNPFVDRE